MGKQGDDPALGHYRQLLTGANLSPMSPEIQTVVALGIVVAAVAFFVTRWLRVRKKPGCGGSCGCGKKDRF